MKICIILRNGSEIWLPDNKAKQLSAALVDGTAPRFVKLTDADDRIINTADIIEFCTAEQMDDKARTKAGEWKCDQGHWHFKKEKCNCSAVAAQRTREIADQKRQEELNKVRTPEEQARVNKRIAEMRENLSKQFGFKFKNKSL